MLDLLAPDKFELVTSAFGGQTYPKQVSAPPYEGSFAIARPLMTPRTSGSKRGPPTHKRSCYLYAVYPLVQPIER